MIFLIGLGCYQWAADKNGTSWKKQLQKDIDELIQIAVTYENFIELIKAKGYEVKGEEFGDKSAKYISFKPTCSKNYIRGRNKSLDSEYTKERIRERIEKHQQKLSKKKVPFPKKKTFHPVIDYSQKSLIDTKVKSSKIVLDCNTGLISKIQKSLPAPIVAPVRKRPTIST